MATGRGHSPPQATPSFEEVLRLQAEEEEEEAREDEVRRATREARHGGAQDEDDDGQRTSPEEGPSPKHADGAVAAAFSLQPEGWLTLEAAAGAGSESKKRWCLLQRCFLFYAGRDKDLTHPKGVVDLKGCDVCVARSASSGVVIPCAFVLSHPRRPALTFVAPTEAEKDGWIHALNTAIRAPTHALLSYKGKKIFDLEDAQAISSSQAAIRAHVQSQFERLASLKREEALKLAKKKVDIKALKANKKSLAKELLAATAAFDQAVADSEALQGDLEDVQREGRAYESAQKQFFVQLVDLLNQMEECDPNRWTGQLSESMTQTSSHFSSPTSQHSGYSGSTFDSVDEDDMFDANFSPVHQPAAQTYQQHSLQASTPPRARSAFSSMTFSTPQQSALRSPFSSPRSGARPPSASRGAAASSTFSPSSPFHVPPSDAPSCIDVSNEQLQLVQHHLETVAQAPLPSVNELATSASSLALSSSSLGLTSLASFSTSDALLTRTDALDLLEIKQSLVDLLQSNLALRKDQNMLTKEIELWMRRKIEDRAILSVTS